MEFRHLRYFVAVAEEKSFTRAARRIRVSQPVLSRQVKKLEDELGVDLLVRDTGSVAISAAGASLLDRAKELLLSASEFALAARAFADCRRKRIDVGYLPPMLGPFLSKALQVFAQTHDGVQVGLHDLPPARQVEALREGRIDIALVGSACPTLEKEFDHFRVRSIPLAAVLSTTHSLAGRKSISLSELALDRFVRLDEDAFPGQMDRVRYLCGNAGFKPKLGPIGDGIGSALALIGSGQGVALMPDEVATIAPENVIFRPLCSPKPVVHLHAIVAKGERRPAIRAFLEECRRQRANAARS